MVFNGLAGTKVVQLEQLPDLDFAVLIMGAGAALDPLDGFRKRLTLQDPVARNQFLGLREWTVYHAAVIAAEPHSSALRTWLQPIALLAGQSDDASLEAPTQRNSRRSFLRHQP